MKFIHQASVKGRIVFVHVKIIQSMLENYSIALQNNISAVALLLRRPTVA